MRCREGSHDDGQEDGHDDGHEDGHEDGHKSRKRAIGVARVRSMSPCGGLIDDKREAT